MARMEGIGGGANGFGWLVRDMYMARMGQIVSFTPANGSKIPVRDCVCRNLCRKLESDISKIFSGFF